MLRIKVVILNWNGSDFLRRFLPSVLATVPPEVGVVVADNASTDNSIELLKTDFPQVELLVFDSNYGFAGGYNRALAMLDSDVFVLLNNDVEPAERWIEPLAAVLEENPAVAAVQPKILSYASRDRFEYAGAAGGFIDIFGYPFCRGRIMGTIERDMGQYDSARKVFWASGACFAVRAEAFRRAGGFDESFFAHMEEIDLCWRMQLVGYDIMVEPRSAVYHVGGGTLPNDSPEKIYLNFRNNLSMMYKNLPRRGMWRLGVRLAADCLSAAVYLFLGRRRFASSVMRAHKDFRRARPSLDRTLAVRATRRPYGVYKGSIVLRYVSGCRKFGTIL